MIRALIFDFDGLILDTESPIYDSWCETYQDYGIKLKFSDWSKIIGSANTKIYDPIDDLESKLGTTLNRKRVEQNRLRRQSEYLKNEKILPGVSKLISSSKEFGLKLGVASSSSRVWVNGHLRELGLRDYFQSVLCSDDVTHTKPNPELYIRSLAALDISAKQAIVLEDSPNGISAAIAAGIFCVAVPNKLTKTLEFDHADMVLNSLDDVTLKDLIGRVVEQRRNFA